MGGGSVSPPPVDPQQQNLEAQQAAALQQQSSIIQQQFKQQQLLAPLIFQSQGLTPTLDAQGNITGFTQSPIQTENTALGQQVQNLTLKQQMQALQGNLPIDPNVTASLNQQEGVLRSSLEKNLGPGYETSSPGIEALQGFQSSKAGTLFSARQGQLSLASNLANINAGTSGISSSNFLRSILAPSTGGLTAASAFGENAAGFGAATQPFQQQEQFGLTARLATQQAQQQTLAGAGSLIGTLALAAALA